MALTTVVLKPYAIMTLEDAKDWLKIKPSNTDNDNTLTRMINTATDMIERYIEGPVLNRKYKEQNDGNSSNVVLCDHWPIRSIDEIKIDFNRDFSDPTALTADNYMLRGPSELTGFDTSTAIGDLLVEVRGSDIVLRDDNNTAILGRIFSGSVIGSIQVVYTAGWGATQNDLPADLLQAAFMLIEFYYQLRESRDLGFKMKKNTADQQYQRGDFADGIPPEITAILDQFKDYSFGHTDVPGRNTFVL